MPNASTLTVSVVPSKGVMPSPQAAQDGANNLKNVIFLIKIQNWENFFREIAQNENWVY